MDPNVIDTKLYTRFAVYLYAFRLETAMLTRYVPLDAADAERSVLLFAFAIQPSFAPSIIRSHVLT